MKRLKSCKAISKMPKKERNILTMLFLRRLRALRRWRDNFMKKNKCKLR